MDSINNSNLSLNDSLDSNASFCLSEPDSNPQSIDVDLRNGSPLNTDDFSIVHYNLNSILTEGRLEELVENVKVVKPDVLVVTESKLDETIDSKQLKIDGFHEPIRKDRNRRGGGCLIYISDDLTYKQQIKLESAHFEHIWVDIRQNNKIYSVNCYYRPPNINNHEIFLQETENILAKLSQHQATEKIVISDLNFGNVYCKSVPLDPKPLDAEAPELFSSFGFKQLIDIPTRVTAVTLENNIKSHTTSLIDLIFCHNLDNIQCHGTLPPIADHSGIFVNFHRIKSKEKNITKHILDYKNMDENGLINYIKDFDFEAAVFSKPLIEQADTYTNIIKEAINKFIPTKKICIRSCDQPWVNSYTRLLLRKKNRNYNIYKKFNSAYISKSACPNASPEVVTRLKMKRDKAFDKSKAASNASTDANRRSKQEFFNTVNNTMHNHNISAKKKFKILTKLMKNQKTSYMPPLIQNDEVVNDAKDKSEILNKLFTDKATVQGSGDQVPILPELDEILSDLSQINTSPIEISKILRTSKRSNSSHCGIPGKVLNIIATPLSFSLSQLLNNCFENGFFPDIFKVSHITALWKSKGLKSDPKMYRPISLLPSLSKVAESVMHSRLINHVLENNLISERQAAYLKGDSTIHQLLYIIDLIRKSWVKGDITQGIFLDVSAAFDKCWHSGILARLKQAKVSGSFYSLFESYLSDRQQCVVVDGQKSKFEYVKAGVPQGSRLGPLLWILYYNSVADGIESEILIFADDVCLFATAKDPALTAEQLNRDLARISLWADTWKVTFDPGKSKDVIFCKNKNMFNSPGLLFDGKYVERVHEHKHLGVYLDSSLSWSKQIHEVCLRANRKMSVLRSVRYLDRSTLDILYKVTIRSVMEYGLICYYNNLTQVQMKRLKQIQYRAAKLCTGALHFSSQVKLEADLAWETMEDRAKILGLSVFHKIHCHETRPLIRSCMPPKNANNTRSQGNYIVPLNRGVQYSNSFFPLMSKSWNSLDKVLKDQHVVSDFKFAIKAKLKPVKYRHFSRGVNKYSNALHCQLRVGRSYLKSHSFAINFTQDDLCLCNCPETTSHYLLTCFLFQPEREALLAKICQLYPPFSRKSLKEQTFILLNGINLDNELPDVRNVQIFYAVQSFILKTKRFNKSFSNLFI